MSRKTLTAKAVVVAGAVAATSLLVGPASAATPTVTKAAPVKYATTVAGTIAITGKDFDSTVTGVVFQNASEYTCVASSVVLVSSTLLYATKPASGCVAGKQKIELHTAATPTDATTQIGSDFNPSAAASTVTFVAPVAATGVDNGTAAATATHKGNGLASGGTTVNVVFSPAVPLTDKLSATIGGKGVGIKRVDTTHFVTVVPAGTPGDADVVLTAGGVAGAAYSGFTYKQSVKVTPAVAPVGTPGEVVLSGVGFKPSSTSKVWVEFCGVAVAPTNTTPKPIADKKLYVNAPSAATIAAAYTTDAAPVTAADGGTCTVKVIVDKSGDSSLASGVVTDGSNTDDVKSVVTKDSLFTYAAY